MPAKIFGHGMYIDGFYGKDGFVRFAPFPATGCVSRKNPIVGFVTCAAESFGIDKWVGIFGEAIVSDLSIPEAKADSGKPCLSNCRWVAASSKIDKVPAKFGTCSFPDSQVGYC